MKKKLKKVLVILLVIALVTGATAGGLYYMRRGKIATVNVVRVESLIDEYYWDDEDSISLSGSIVANTSQNISIDSGSSGSSSDITVDKVFVSEGDRVKVGDPIVSFDTTLADMRLNIMRLRLQQSELEMNNVLGRMEYLRNGGDPAALYETDDPLGGTSDLDFDLEDDDEDEGDLDMSLGRFRGQFLAFVRLPLLFAFEGAGSLWESFDDEESPQESLEGDAAEIEDGDLDDDGDDDMGEEDLDEEDEFSDGIGTFSDGGENNDMVFDPDDGRYLYPGLMGDAGDSALDEDDPDALFSAERPSPDDFTSGVEDHTTLIGSGVPSAGGYYPWLMQEGQAAVEGDAGGLGDGEDPYYRIIDWNTRPFCGQGTESDPYVYLCTCAKGKVTLTGAFLNLMAGYNPMGTIKEREQGYWYQLEWHKYDTIENYENRRESCTGYYLISGDTLPQSVDATVTTTFFLDDASVYEVEPLDEGDGLGDDDMDLEGDDDLGDVDDDDEPGRNTSNREDIMNSLQKMSNTLMLSIRKQEIAIEKQEKVCAKKLISAKIDGVVAKVGDVYRGGSNVITIKSNEGYYVQGTVSELMLQTFLPGTKLSCTDWYSGARFTATVIEVSEYPATGSYYSFSDNPNASFYNFTASIDDQEKLTLSETSWLNISIVKNVDDSNALVIDRAFVRSENGSHYVYKDVNGTLQKSYVRVDAIVSYGTDVKVGAGLRRSDLIAFPYGDLKDGMPTKQVSVDEIKGYSDY